MVLQGVLVQHDEPLKEFKGEEMDANVGGAVHQASVLVPFLSRLLGDLRVLDHLVVALHLVRFPNPLATGSGLGFQCPKKWELFL